MTKFVRPTVKELREYAQEIGYISFDVRRFVDHYDANGWRVGKVPMKDWKATVRNWRRHDSEFKHRSEARMPMGERNTKIGQLNRRKAELMRMPDSPKVRQELEQIRIQLYQL